MTTIRFLCFFTILVYLCACSGPENEAHEEEQPNIIFLLTDDLRYDAMSHMGNPHIQTPHLDQLAKDGSIFTHAYHVSPICMPSRASIMTGLYLGTHGTGFDAPTNHRITEQMFASSYPILLRNAGYFTGFIGKFGFPVSNDSSKAGRFLVGQQENLPTASFDVWNGFPGQGAYFPKDGQFNGYENFSGAKHLNEFMGDQAIAFMKTAQETSQPFCLSISFKAPHAPFTPEADMRALYEEADIPRMANDKAEIFEKLPYPVQTVSRNAIRYFGKGTRYEPVWHLEKDEAYQEFIKNYYGLISGVDRVVGRIREELKQAGLWENTVIIFTSDNGFFCGSRQLTGKGLLYEESVKAPLIVYDPRISQAEKEIHSLVSHIDLAPTILDLASLSQPTHMPGTSILPLLSDATPSLHDAVYGENNFNNFGSVPTAEERTAPCESIRSKFIRTSRFKFIRYHECKPVIEELWDMQVDSGETTNLIDDPAYEKIATDMRERLDQFEANYVRYANP